VARPQLRVICPLVKNVTPHRRTRSHLDCREESFIASHVVSAYVSVVQVHASNFRYGRIRMQVYIATSIAFLAFSSSFWHVLSASLSFFSNTACILSSFSHRTTIIRSFSVRIIHCRSVSLRG